MASNIITPLTLPTTISTKAQLIDITRAHPQVPLLFGLTTGSELEMFLCSGVSRPAFCLATYYGDTTIDIQVFSRWQDYMKRYNPTTDTFTRAKTYIDTVDSVITRVHECTYTSDATIWNWSSTSSGERYSLNLPLSVFSNVNVDTRLYTPIVTRCTSGSRYNKIIRVNMKYTTTENNGTLSFSNSASMLTLLNTNGKKTGGTARIAVSYFRKKYDMNDD